MARKIIGALSSMFLASASCKRSRDFKRVIKCLHTAYGFYISTLAQPVYSILPHAVDKCLRGTEGVPRKGVWTSVDRRVWPCKESRAKHDQTSCCLRPPFLGTLLVPSRVAAALSYGVRSPGLSPVLSRTVWMMIMLSLSLLLLLLLLYMTTMIIILIILSILIMMTLIITIITIILLVIIIITHNNNT